MWDSFLQFVNLLVSPDWTSLVGLVPLGVGALVVLYLVWQVRRAVTVPPRMTRGLPVGAPPPGTHSGAGSAAPILAAFGAACFVIGLLFVKVGPRLDPATKQPIENSTTWTIAPLGGLALAVGLVALIGGLLYWGRESLRDYDALEAPARLPAVVAEPPEGVHLPAPSFRPLLMSLAAAVMFLGLAVRAIPIAVAGVVMIVTAGLGWLGDARAEYRNLERADMAGHPAAHPAPGAPVRTLAAFAGLLAVAVLITAGVIPPGQGTGGASPKPAAGGGAASARPSAAASAAASGAPASPAPGGSGSGGAGGGSATRLQLVAQGIAYQTDSLTAPAGTPFQIVFTNSDAGIPHNVSIHTGSATGTALFTGTVFPGVATQTYDIPALAAGTYYYVCSVHSTMVGTLTVQ